MSDLKHPIPLGTLVSFSFGYHRKCSHRFQNLDEANPKSYVLVCEIQNEKGFIVGMRTVIMDRYKFHFYTSHEGPPEPAYASGKREQVYLVAKNHTTLPWLVRKKDITATFARHNNLD